MWTPKPHCILLVLTRYVVFRRSRQSRVCGFEGNGRQEDKTIERKIWKFVRILNWNWHRPRCYTTNSYWRMFLYLAQFTWCTRHVVPRLVVLVPLLVAPVGGCPAVVCLYCTRPAVQRTDAAEPRFIKLFQVLWIRQLRPMAMETRCCQKQVEFQRCPP